MPGRAALTLVVLAGLIAATPVLAGDAQDEEVPVLPDRQAVAPPPSAPPRPMATPRRSTCPPAVRLRRIPVYEDVEVPVFEQCSVPRYREIPVPVFKNRIVPVYATRRVPVFEDSCVLTFDLPCIPRMEVVRRQTGWCEERVLRGQRLERVRCGTRPHRIRDGVSEQRVQTGTRRERRLVGWRAEPGREGPVVAPRVCEGVLKPCAR